LLTYVGLPVALTVLAAGALGLIVLMGKKLQFIDSGPSALAVCSYRCFAALRHRLPEVKHPRCCPADTERSYWLSNTGFAELYRYRYSTSRAG
jgi:hypothetical protein